MQKQDIVDAKASIKTTSTSSFDRKTIDIACTSKREPGLHPKAELQQKQANLPQCFKTLTLFKRQVQLKRNGVIDLTSWAAQTTEANFQCQDLGSLQR